MADLRTERTYNSLKEAFLTLLEHNRFESITVLQLCQCANIRRATFYSHFADKYEFMSFLFMKCAMNLSRRLKKKMCHVTTVYFTK